MFYKLSCAGKGADTPEETGLDQISAIRVQFVSEREEKTSADTCVYWAMMWNWWRWVENSSGMSRYYKFSESIVAVSVFLL